MAGVAALILLPATPAGAQGAKKHPLVGPAAVIWCDDLTPVPWEDTSVRVPGFAVFNANGSGRLSVVVSMKRAQPRTEFPVRLIQGNAGDCWTVDGVLTTNGQGNGTLRLAEPVVGTRAQIIVDTSALFDVPTFRATEIFEIG